MGFPYDADVESIVGGTTTIKKTWGDAVVAALRGLYSGTKSVLGVAFSQSTSYGAVSIPGSGETKPYIYIGDAPTTRQLVEQWKIGTGVWARRYQLLNGGEELTFNAAWSPGTSQWSLDDGGKVAMSFRHVQTTTVATTYQLKKDAASGAWADGSWDEVFRCDRAGGVYLTDLIAHGSVQLDGGGAYVIHKKYTTTLQTTDNTSTDFIVYTTPNNSVTRVTARVNGIRSDHAAGACYWKTYPMKNNAGSGSAVGGGVSDVVPDAEDDATWGGVSSTGWVGAVFKAQVQGKAATIFNDPATTEIETVLL